MAGNGGASMVESEGNKIGSCDSENGNNTVKSGEEEEDRFSALPDFLIHHILSLLPAIDLVKTHVLSKWWKYKWTHVPVLDFVPHFGMSSGFSHSRMSGDKFSNFIDRTLILHDCSKIDKFKLHLKWFHKTDEFPNLDLWIHFAVRKDVKELIVRFNDHIDQCYLPEFLLNNSSLVRLELCCFSFMDLENVSWGSLKSLCLDDCEMEDGTIETVISGTPRLEYLKLSSCYESTFRELVIASKSLKTLILDGVNAICEVLEISCPNLERLRISSLVWFTSLKLMNLPCSVYATIDFYFDMEELEDQMSEDDHLRFVQQTLRQILESSKEDGDCIGGLPDDLIHRIISFLPAAKVTFESDFYQKWEQTWADVPILNFVSNEKFVIDSKDIPLAYLDPRLSLWIRFAAKNNVKELILDSDSVEVEFGHEYALPQFLFNNSSLVNVKISACAFAPNGKVNWESLKSLRLDHSKFGVQAIEHVLSGSPLLECLELHSCDLEGETVVASECLRTLILVSFNNCALLEISCPNLESLKIQGFVCSTRIKLTNLPSSLHATLDVYIVESDDIGVDDCGNIVEWIMKLIQHAAELEIELSTYGERETEHWFLKIGGVSKTMETSWNIYRCSPKASFQMCSHDLEKDGFT